MTLKCHQMADGGRGDAGSESGVACCDTLRLRADLPTLPSESDYESPCFRTPIFSDE